MTGQCRVPAPGTDCRPGIDRGRATGMPADPPPRESERYRNAVSCPRRLRDRLQPVIVRLNLSFSANLNYEAAAS